MAARPTDKNAEPPRYNVRDYQNPDAGAADQPLTKAAKSKTEAKGKGMKGVALALVCFHCGKSGAKLRSCGQCHRAYYCDRECQRKDWKRRRGRRVGGRPTRRA